MDALYMTWNEKPLQTKENKYIFGAAHRFDLKLIKYQYLN